MITWIQNTFQHHFRIVFLVLLACTVISFIVVIGNQPGIGHGEAKIHGQDFFGLNLANRKDAERLHGDASISVELQYGYPVLDANRLQQYALVRQACLHLADRLHVPAPTDAELTQAVQQLRMFAGQDGKFDAKRYQDFQKSIKQNSRIKESDIVRVISDNLRIEKVQKLIAGPGITLPAEVVQQLEKTDTSWTVAVATLDRASFQPAINPGDAELTKYFEENKFRYTIPARIIVTYADFPTSSFASSITPTEQDLRAYFDANPGRFSARTEPGKAPAAGSTDFNQVRDQVQQAFVQERASRLAAQAANRLSLSLYDKKLTPGTPEFEQAVKSAGAVVADLPPFSAETVPPQLGNNPDVAEEAFRLNKNRTVSDAVATDHGSAVLFFKGSIEPEQPAFSAVRAKVLADYVENERAKRFVAAGESIRSQAQAAVKSGTAFAKAVETAAAAQGIKVTVATPPAFTLREPPKDLNTAVYGALDSLKAQEVSAMTVAGDQGVLVFAQERKVPSLDASNPNYAALRTQMAQTLGNGNASEYLEDMIAQELEKSRTVTR